MLLITLSVRLDSALELAPIYSFLAVKDKDEGEGEGEDEGERTLEAI